MKNFASPCKRVARVWNNDSQYPVHFVGVIPKWAGQKLGFCVSCVATESFKTDGGTDAALNTDAHRLAALKTYLRIDYRPQIRHEAHVEIWKKVLRQIGFAHIEV